MPGPRSDTRPGEHAGPSPRGIGRFRLEDLLLAAWVGLVAPLLGSGPGASSVVAGPDPLLGWLDVIGLLAFAACVGARSGPGVDSGLVDRTDLRYAVGPLFGAVAFTLDDIAERLGLSGGWASLPLVAAAVVAVMARLRLPPLTSSQRRTLVTPFILVTSRFFGQVLGGLTGLLDLRTLAAELGRAGAIGETAFVVVLAVLGMAIFYVMLVFAPRQIADREGTSSTWFVRFALFVASIAVGQTVAGIAHPL